MRINRITANNFKTLDNVEINFSGYYCTVSGQNNCGKTSVIQILTNLLQKQSDSNFFTARRDNFSFSDDVTQWSDDKSCIKIEIEIEINKRNDPAIYDFIERFTGDSLLDGENSLNVFIDIYDQKRIYKCEINQNQYDPETSREIILKIESLKVILYHDSANRGFSLFFSGRNPKEIFDVDFSHDEKNELAKIDRQLENKIKKFAKRSKEELTEMIGRLSDKYEVELSPLDTFSSTRIPLGVNLKDKTVEIPFLAWGSGTQNRTRILMSILSAQRIKFDPENEDKVTPIVIIEEPESFLHPSAQAEFGKLLQEISQELEIQVIATTHSPFMLNNTNPESNILLERKIFRGKPKETIVCSTNGENWMQPFSEHLGVTKPDFLPWSHLFFSTKKKIIFVEGEIDKKYIDYWRSIYKEHFSFGSDVEIYPYGGADIITNTPLVNFIIKQIDNFLITYDLDVDDKVSKKLESIGLARGTDFMAIGQNKIGKRSIEGLLPDQIYSEVGRKSPELIRTLSHGNKDEVKSARSSIKSRCLDEFKNTEDLDEKEIKDILNLGKTLSKKFNN